MPMFQWEGTAQDGSSKKGAMEAGSASEVEERLRSLSIDPTKVGKQKKDFQIKIPDPKDPPRLRKDRASKHQSRCRKQTLRARRHFVQIKRILDCMLVCTRACVSTCSQGP